MKQTRIVPSLATLAWLAMAGCGSPGSHDPVGGSQAALHGEGSCAKPQDPGKCGKGSHDEDGGKSNEKKNEEKKDKEKHAGGGGCDGDKGEHTDGDDADDDGEHDDGEHDDGEHHDQGSGCPCDCPGSSSASTGSGYYPT